MTKRIIFTISSLLIGIPLSILLSLTVGLLTMVTSFVDFWKGMITSLRTYPNHIEQETLPNESIWQKHMRLKGIPPLPAVEE